MMRFFKYRNFFLLYAPLFIFLTLFRVFEIWYFLRPESIFEVWDLFTISTRYHASIYAYLTLLFALLFAGFSLVKTSISRRIGFVAAFCFVLLSQWLLAILSGLGHFIFRLYWQQPNEFFCQETAEHWLRIYQFTPLYSASSSSVLSLLLPSTVFYLFCSPLLFWLLKQIFSAPNPSAQSSKDWPSKVLLFFILALLARGSLEKLPLGHFPVRHYPEPVKNYLSEQISHDVYKILIFKFGFTTQCPYQPREE